MAKKGKSKKQYKAQYYDPVMKKRTYIGLFDTRQEANEAQKQYKLELEGEAETPDQDDMIVLDLCNLYGDYVKDNNVASTYKRYISFLRFIHMFGLTVYPVNELPPLKVNEYIEYRKKKRRRKTKNGPGTIGGVAAAKYDLIILRAMYNWGGKLGYCKHEPTIGVRPFSPDVKERYVPSDEDLDKVISMAKKEHQRDFLTVMKYTGARPIELQRAKFEDIDWNKKTITLWSRKKQHGVKTPRSVPLHKEVIEVFKKRLRNLDVRNINGHVFWEKTYSKHGCYEGPYRYNPSIISAICKRAGVKPFTQYSIRHWFATKLALKVGNGYSVQDLSKILGHSKIQTTMIYVHSNDEARRNAIETLF